MKFEELRPGELFECMNYQINGEVVQGLKIADGRFARLGDGKIDAMMPNVDVVELWWARDPCDRPPSRVDQSSTLE